MVGVSEAAGPTARKQTDNDEDCARLFTYLENNCHRRTLHRSEILLLLSLVYND